MDSFAFETGGVKEGRRVIFILVLVFDFLLLSFEMQDCPPLRMVKRRGSVE